MKITKELFNKTISDEIANILYLNNSTSKLEFILTKITKKSCYCLNGFISGIDTDGILDGKNEEIENFKTELIKNYQLISMDCLCIDYRSANREIKRRSHFYLGEDMIIEMIGSVINTLVYNEDSLETIKEIYQNYTDLVLPIIEKKEESKRCIKFLEINFKNEIEVRQMAVDLSDIKIDKLFNQDLKNEKILNLIKSDRGGFFIFHGKPGCGKSTYLKYLMETLSKNVNFFIVPQEIILGCPQQFRRFIISRAMCEKNNNVFILEDCEKIITSRDKAGGNNSIVLSELLNISDGILGDFLKAKFICTFNTDLTNIDKALLRKGRLLMKYEFKPLYGEKLYDLAKDLKIENLEKKEMSLAEIFNHNEDNGFTDEERKRIGF